MSNTSSTDANSPPVVVLACSGCSAAGELADHTARRLWQLGSLAVNGATVTRPAEAALRVLGEARYPETP